MKTNLLRLISFYLVFLFLAGCGHNNGGSTTSGNSYITSTYNVEATGIAIDSHGKALCLSCT